MKNIVLMLTLCTMLAACSKGHDEQDMCRCDEYKTVQDKPDGVVLYQEENEHIIPCSETEEVEGLFQGWDEDGNFVTLIIGCSAI